MELTGNKLTMAVDGLAWQQKLTVAQSHKRAKMFCVRLSNWLDDNMARIKAKKTRFDPFFCLEEASECRRCQVLMETDWEVSSDNVVRPDILVTCEELAERVIKTPALIAEVISASSAKRDENLKSDLYRKEGVFHYLLIYPEKRLPSVPIYIGTYPEGS